MIDKELGQEVSLPSGTKEINELITAREYSLALKNINKYLKLWPLEQYFYFSKVYCYIFLNKYHDCLLTIATYHGQQYMPRHENSKISINASKEHISSGICKWLHYEQSLSLYYLGKYNLALKALLACKENVPPIQLERRINQQNIDSSNIVLDDYASCVSHLSANEQVKYLHLLAQIMLKLERYEEAIAIYNKLLPKSKDQDSIVNNTLVAHLLSAKSENSNYAAMEAILQKYLSNHKIKAFELAFNSSLVQSLGHNIDEAKKYLEIPFDTESSEREGLLIGAQRLYLRMREKDVETESFFDVFLDQIKSDVPITALLLLTATNMLIYTKNVDIKRLILLYLLKWIYKGIDHLDLTSYEIETFYTNVLSSLLQLEMLQEFQYTFNIVKAKRPAYDNVRVFTSNLYYVQNRVLKSERALIEGESSFKGEKEALAYMVLNYINQQYSKVLEAYRNHCTSLKEELHKATLLALRSVFSAVKTPITEFLEEVAGMYNKICQAQSIPPFGYNLLIIAMLYIQTNHYDKASSTYKQILFGGHKYEDNIVFQASNGLAFVESFSEDYKLWSLDFNTEGRYALLNKFQQSIYDNIKYIDAESLEKEGISYVHSSRETVLPESPKRKKKTNKKRSRRHKMPASVLELGPPDPERWLPKHERSSAKKLKKKKNDILTKSTQGSTVTNVVTKPTTANIPAVSSPQKRDKRSKHPIH